MEQPWSIDITIGGVALSIGHNWVSGSDSEELDKHKDKIIETLRHVLSFMGESSMPCEQCGQPMTCLNCEGERGMIR